MSFTAYHTAPVDRSAGVLPTAANGHLGLQSGVDTEQAEVLAACERAAEILADALGRPADQIRVNIVGHVNPGHAPFVGWSDEFVTVTVSISPIDEAAPTSG